MPELAGLSVAVIRVHDLDSFRILSHDRVSINPSAPDVSDSSGKAASAGKVEFNAVIDCKDPRQGQTETYVSSQLAGTV